MLKESEKWKSRWKVRDLLTDGRCSGEVLDFRSTTDVGKLVPAEDNAGRGVSEWELRELREREEERGADVGELGVEEEPPLFLPTPHFIASAGEDFFFV